MQTGNQDRLGPEESRSQPTEELSHFDSRWCWCEPSEEWDEMGDLVLVHRNVTWN
jgi:hypothetical protein